MISFAGRSKIPTHPPVSVTHPCPQKTWVFSDLDGSWLGEQRLELEKQIKQMGDHLTLVYATARSAPEVLSLGLMEPAFTIAENGGLIYENLPKDEKKRIHSWEAAMGKASFNRPWIEEMVRDLGKAFNLRIQTVDDLRKTTGNIHKSAYMCYPVIPQEDVQRDPQNFQAFLTAVQTKLDTQKMDYRFLAYPFAGQPYVALDITATTLSKGGAIRHLMDTFGLTAQQIIVAGDGSNDIPMMENDGRRVIVLGENEKLLAHVQQNFSTETMQHFPTGDSSLGILKGLLNHLKSMGKPLPKVVQFCGRPASVALNYVA